MLCGKTAHYNFPNPTSLCNPQVHDFYPSRDSSSQISASFSEALCCTPFPCYSIKFLIIFWRHFDIFLKKHVSTDQSKFKTWDRGRVDKRPFSSCLLPLLFVRHSCFILLSLIFLVLIFKLQVGQWGEAEFGSEERNEKFLRLMGAFKKKPFTQAHDADVSLQSSRRCMTKDTESSLTQRLEQQYESAMNFSRKRRGLGLGYNPDEDPSKKTFYIDKNGSKSVKLS